MLKLLNPPQHTSYSTYNPRTAIPKCRYPTKENLRYFCKTTESPQLSEETLITQLVQEATNCTSSVKFNKWLSPLREFTIGSYGAMHVEKAEACYECTKKSCVLVRNLKKLHQMHQTPCRVPQMDNATYFD